MRILDMSAGKRMMWFDKKHPATTFVDLREGVSPSVVADTKQLPFAAGVFDFLVFDPPHVNVGANSNMSRDFGHYTSATIRDLVNRTGAEAHRVAKHDALMAFKWNDHDQSFVKILVLLNEWWKPLFGQRVTTRSKHACTTAWVMLQRCG